jgi:hypothetical protein
MLDAFAGVSPREPLVGPKAKVEAQHHAGDGAHRQMLERVRFGAKRWFEGDRPSTIGRSLQHAERHRDDRRSRRHRLASRDVHHDTSRPPAHSRDDGREPDAGRERFGKPGHHATVAFDDTRQTPLTNVVTGAASFSEGCGARQVRVGGVKALDILAGECPFWRKAASARLGTKHLVDAAIGLAVRVEQAHPAIEALPEIVQRPQPGWRGLPAGAAHVGRGQRGLIQQLLQHGRRAVNEFGAQLNWPGCLGIGDRQDAPAYAVTRLEDFDINAGLVQCTRGGQSGSAGANHDDHAPECTAIDDGRLMN